MKTKMRLIDVADWLCKIGKKTEAIEILKIKNEYLEKNKVELLFQNWFDDGSTIFRNMECDVITIMAHECKKENYPF